MRMSLGRWTFLPAAVTTVAVVMLSLGNPLQLDAELFDFLGLDKLQHLAAYATLGVLWSWALHVELRRPGGLRVGSLALWAALTLLGVGLEIMQWAFYPGRLFEFGDMVANGVGAALGCFVFTRTFRS